jgi:ubiquinone/menaquinone biosynthesis C-methylase UbiE
MDIPYPEGPRTRGPSMLDLVRLSPVTVFPPGGEALYRQIGLLTEMAAGHEVLDVACGRGVSTSFLVSTFDVDAQGVEEDVHLVDEAELRAREAGMAHRLQFQEASPEELPYRDAIFDVTIGEIGLARSADPQRAIAELVRVTKPMGSVVLVQLIWTGNLDAERKERLVEYLGARPMLPVEWKQMLREAGVVELHAEDWSDRSTAIRPEVHAPFPDFAQIFTVREKLGILRRAMRRWGWRGVRGAVMREQEIHKLLTRERVLGLTLIKGTRWAGGEG